MVAVWKCDHAYCALEGLYSTFSPRASIRFLASSRAHVWILHSVDECHRG